MTQESRTENGATLTSSYIYDALGQLTSFTRSDGQSVGQGTVPCPTTKTTIESHHHGARS